MTEQFAVLDFETTGFGSTDRVIEIGVVLLDAALNVEGTWETLVQPGRDIPNSFVHKLSASDLVDAPDFAAVAPHFARVMDGRTMVAHNSMFEARFLNQEFGRLGHRFETRGRYWLDTMPLTHRLLGEKKLGPALELAGITNRRPHSALADAEATADLLRHLVQVRGASLGAPTGVTMPRLRPDTQITLRPRGQAEEPAHWLAGLAKLLPEVGSAQVDEYRKHLTAALADNALSASEVRTLERAARQSGLSMDDLMGIHEEFLRQLAIEAWFDGVITEAELAQLHALAEQLGLPASLVRELVAAPIAGERRASLQLEAGDRVTFTGALELPREEWEARAAAVGLDVGGVTKNSKVVVSANPDSMSGKARRARVLGIPIVDEKTFAMMLGAMGTQGGLAPSDAAVAAAGDEGASPDGSGRFPWLQPGDAVTETSSPAAIARAWIHRHGDRPLAQLSPYLEAEQSIESLGASKTASRTWAERHPRMLQASVDDLHRLPGVGPVKVQSMVESVVLAALDAVELTEDHAEEETQGGLAGVVAEAHDRGHVYEEEHPRPGEAEVAHQLALVAGWQALSGAAAHGADLPEPVRVLAPDAAALLDPSGGVRALLDLCVAQVDAACSNDAQKRAVFTRRIVRAEEPGAVAATLSLTVDDLTQLEATIRHGVGHAALAHIVAEQLARLITSSVRGDVAAARFPQLADAAPGFDCTVEELLLGLFAGAETEPQPQPEPADQLAPEPAVEPQLIDADIQESRDVYFRDGTWQLLLEVTRDHLSDSGVAVPAGIASFYQVPVGGEVLLNSKFGDLALALGVDEPTQVRLSTIRRFLADLGVREGERVWLRFDQDRAFAVTRAPARIGHAGGLDAILDRFGLGDVAELSDDAAKFAAINDALGLDPGAPRRRAVALLGHRRQDDLADILRAL